MRTPLLSLSLMMICGPAAAVAAQIVELEPSVPGGGGPPISHIGGLTFSFISRTGTSPSQGPCFIEGIDNNPCDFVNVSGQTWQTLVFIASPGNTLTSCAILEPFFTTCSVDQQGTSVLPSIVRFSGGPGIQSSEAFGLAVVGWAPDTTFTITANAPPAVPEPGTWCMMLLGLGCVVAARKHVVRWTAH